MDFAWKKAHWSDACDWLITERVENPPPLNVDNVAQTANITVVNAK
jgi:hypothetical protein